MYVHPVEGLEIIIGDTIYIMISWEHSGVAVAGSYRSATIAVAMCIALFGSRVTCYTDACIVHAANCL